VNATDIGITESSPSNTSSGKQNSGHKVEWLSSRWVHNKQILLYTKRLDIVKLLLAKEGSMNNHNVKGIRFLVKENQNKLCVAKQPLPRVRVKDELFSDDI
jgi:hypothetical protein